MAILATVQLEQSQEVAGTIQPEPALSQELPRHRSQKWHKAGIHLSGLPQSLVQVLIFNVHKTQCEESYSQYSTERWESFPFCWRFQFCSCSSGTPHLEKSDMTRLDFGLDWHHSLITHELIPMAETCFAKPSISSLSVHADLLPPPWIWADLYLL